MIDHSGVSVSDVAKSKVFYRAALAPLGYTLLMEFEQFAGFGVAPKPDFWIGAQQTGEGFRESHIAFAASDRTTVDTFFRTAVDAGAEVLHAPRMWPEYHPHYYGAFVRDPDGNNVEAVCHSASPEPEQRA